MSTRSEPPQGIAARRELAIELGLILGLFLFYLFAFGRMGSPVHGPLEIFAQDSVYILGYLGAGAQYHWNPQNHLLYHVLIEKIYAPWQAWFGGAEESTFRYLKLFTALTGLAFLVALRALLKELRLGFRSRIILLLLTAVSVSIWFHFSAFETHALAMPAIAVYLRSVVRLRDRERRTRLDRILFVGSLLMMGWTRVDLFRFTLASAALPLLPATRRWWRGLVVDLALVAVVGAAGNAVLAGIYFEVPPWEAAARVLERRDRKWLSSNLRAVDNLTPANLARVGRATTLYSMMMPIERRAPGRSWLAPPTYHLDVEWARGEDRPSTRLFHESFRNLLGNALSCGVAIGMFALFLPVAGSALARAARGDPLHVLCLAQAASGWLLYTWFNPYEPFLWILEYVPLWIVLASEFLRPKGRGAWVMVAVLAVGLAAHNLFAFYLPLR